MRKYMFWELSRLHVNKGMRRRQFPQWQRNVVMDIPLHGAYLLLCGDWK